MSPAERRTYSILVPSAGSTAGIGVIRSLGAAGYRVHAAASNPRALGMRSRFAAARVLHPPASTDELIPWLRDYVAQHDIKMVMPGLSLDLRQSAMADLKHLFPMSTDANVLDATSSKAGLFARLLEGDASHRANLPPSLVYDFDSANVPEKALTSLPLPLFIKLDGSMARNRGRDAVIRIANVAEARRKLDFLAAEYRRVLVQGYVPGRGAGAFILRWNGRSIANMMHMRLHEMPHTGGASSLRRTWWHQRMMDDAECKLSYLGWKGVAMVEYRWDPTKDQFYLMEMNLRFWGSLHLALYAGVDFPRLLADAFLVGELPSTPVQANRDVICRNTFPFEIGYLVSLWRDSQVPLSRKLFSGLEAISLSLNPRIRTDLFFPGDRWLYFVMLKEMVPELKGMMMRGIGRG
jgi:predicted ATP-grasp superfamily ATP-dependent carboligase